MVSFIEEVFFKCHFYTITDQLFRGVYSVNFTLFADGRFQEEGGKKKEKTHVRGSKKRRKGKKKAKIYCAILSFMYLSNRTHMGFRRGKKSAVNLVLVFLLDGSLD